MKAVSIKPIAKYLKNPPKISNLMKEHIKTGRTLIDSNYKKGSPPYFKLFKEARELYSKGIINILDQHDLNLIKNTKLGEIIEHKGSKFPLDFPITENFIQYIYNLDPVDKSINKILINESYDDRLFQVEVRIILDKVERDINDILSDIRAIEGITIVHIEDVDDLWSIETQHNVKVKIKIDPAPFQSMSKAIFNMILNKIKKMPGVLKATYVSKVKVL